MDAHPFAVRFNPNNPDDVQRFFHAFDVMAQTLRAHDVTLDQLRNAGAQSHASSEANHQAQTQTTGQLRDQLQATATQAAIAEAGGPPLPTVEWEAAYYLAVARHARPSLGPQGHSQARSHWLL